MRHEYVNLSWLMAAEKRSAQGHLRRFSLLIRLKEGNSVLLLWILFCLTLALGTAATLLGSQGWLSGQVEITRVLDNASELLNYPNSATALHMDLF